KLEVAKNPLRSTIMVYPTTYFALKFKRSKAMFTKYWYTLSSMNYQYLNECGKPLEDLMKKTKIVKIVAPGTNISFSIENADVVLCTGEWNIPDGEVFAVPNVHSANGYITYNIPSPYFGHIHNNVRLEYEKGRLINYDGDDKANLDIIFSSDEGALYVGEFAIGINPLIQQPACDILFDEKMHGSIHFTPGGYTMVDNQKVMSNLHWDLVLMLKKEYGGGQLYFDDVLIMDDGDFVHQDLQALRLEPLTNEIKKRL
ncbi:MAG: aminopeptidase, partial [Bacilli bacterium]